MRHTRARGDDGSASTLYPDELKCDPLMGIRPSGRVRTVAKLLDVDESDIRRLLAGGILEGHRIGKRGVRIFLDSVARYQEQQEIQATRTPAVEPARRARRLPAEHYRAMEELRKAGIIP